MSHLISLVQCLLEIEGEDPLKIIRMVWSRQTISYQFITPDNLLVYATQHGYEKLCILAKELGARNFYAMKYFAEIFNHENIFHLAKEWGATCGYWTEVK